MHTPYFFIVLLIITKHYWFHHCALANYKINQSLYSFNLLRAYPVPAIVSYKPLWASPSWTATSTCKTSRVNLPSMFSAEKYYICISVRTLYPIYIGQAWVITWPHTLHQLDLELSSLSCQVINMISNMIDWESYMPIISFATVHVVFVRVL